MSEKRSWDIQPRKKVSVQPQAAPTPARQQRPADIPRRTPIQAPRPIQTLRRPPPPAARIPNRVRPPDRVSERTQPPVIRREKIPQGREREPLKVQRRRQRRRTSGVLSILFILLVAGIFVCLWLPVFRVREVDAAGPDSNGMQTIATNDLAGTYDYAIPRNSIIFFPENEINSQILEQYPDISALSISRESFDAIAIDAIPRETAFIWCGTTYADAQNLSSAPFIETASSTATSSASDIPPVINVPSCYDADSQGFIFAVNETGTSTATDVLQIYGSLASSTVPDTSLIGQTVAEASYIPNALEFVKAIKSLGVNVVALVIRTDEADLYTQAGTRITYVLGQEAAAAELAESAFPSLNLNDGSLEYVDLRFDDKVYFKKSAVGSVATSTDE